MSQQDPKEQKKVTIVVDAQILINRGLLDLPALGALRAEFTRKNPDRAKKERMGFWVENLPETICSAGYEEPFVTFPRGALARVVEILEKRGYLVDRIIDRSLKLERLDLRLRRELRPYQVDAVRAVVRSGNCVFRGPPGSGKTCVLIGVIAELRQPTLVLVHTSALKRQWEARIAEWLDVVPGSIGGGGKANVRPITVAMLQTLHRQVAEHPEWLGRFGCIIADECHHVPALTWYEAMSAFPAAYKIGASADERRKDGLEFLLYDALGPCAHVIPKDALVEQEQLMPVEMRLVRTGYEDERYLEDVTNGLPPDWGAMLDRLIDDEDRRGLVLGTILQLLNEDRGNRLLVLSERVQACHDLRDDIAASGFECGLMVGGAMNRGELERSIAGLKTGRVRVAAGTKVADEGLDIPQLTHVLVTCPLHTHAKRLEQMAGRAARTCEGKRGAFCVYFWDSAMFPHPASSKLDRARRWGRFRRAMMQACSSLREWDPATGRVGPAM